MLLASISLILHLNSPAWGFGSARSLGDAQSCSEILEVPIFQGEMLTPAEAKNLYSYVDLPHELETYEFRKLSKGGQGTLKDLGVFRIIPKTPGEKIVVVKFMSDEKAIQEIIAIELW